MKFLRFLSAILPVSIGLSFAGSALADQFEVYQIATAGKTKIHFVGGNFNLLNATFSITVQNAPKIKVLTLNNCGMGKFKESATAPITSMSVGSIPVSIIQGWGSPPVCSKDAATGVYSSTNDLPVGQAGKTTDGYIYYKGGTTVGAATLNVASSSIKQIKTNQCGLAGLTLPTGVTQFSTDSQSSYNINSNVPVKNYPYICKKVGNGSYTIYSQKGGL
jgi:hypothetical protein